MSARWIAANNGTGKRIWFVVREDLSRYRESATGRISRYRSYDSAQRKADELNRLEDRS